MNKKEFICTTCYKVGNSVKKTPGSIWIEIILWLFFLLPGVIYSVWRLMSKKEVCQSCGNPTLIPIDTPKGQELFRKHKQ